MQETNESLGTYLKRSREGKNVSIEQVAYATRISLKMLRALEDDNHATLPAPTFVRGYLQAYAKYIRIDTQDLLLRYQHHLATSPDHKRNTIRSHYLYVRERYQEKRRLVLVIVLFATMLSVAGTYFLLKAKRDHHKRLAQTTAEIQKGESKASPALPLALTPPTPSEKVAEMLDKEKKETPPKTEAKVETKTETQAETETQTEVKVESRATELKNKLKAAVGLSTATHTQTEAKKETPPAPAPAPAPVAVVAPIPAPLPAPVVAAPKPTATATATATATQTQVSVADSSATIATDSKKAYNLLLKTDQDVWLRFQTDQDAVRDLTLRGGKAMMLRADSVIKIFSGNLTAFKATLNGKPLANLAPSNRVKSVVVPDTEAPKYPPPLFPQFQPKQDAEQNKKSDANSAGNAASGNAAQ